MKHFWLGLCALCLLLAGLAFTPSTTAAESPVVVIETSLGDITVELNKDRAPVTVENFLQYVQDDFYDGTVFHRVIRGFMIQGGGFTEDLQKKSTRPAIKNEGANGLKNRSNTIAMARLPDPHSATAQFFINTSNNQALDHKGMGARDFGYAVFGKVIEGMEVVTKIETVKTGSKGPFSKDAPVESVVIKTIRLKTE